MSIRRRSLFPLFMVVICVCLPSVAQARVFAEPGEITEDGYKYVENPDGTVSEYYQAPGTGRTPVRGPTYSKAGIEESDLVDSQIGVDEGTTSQSGSVVIGSDGNNIWAAEHVVGDMRTGLPYSTPGEAEVGDELITEGISEGTLPDLATVAGAAVGSIVTGGAVIAAGVALGVGIDDLLGEPTFGDQAPGIEFEPGCFYEHQRNCEYFSQWGNDVKIGEIGACEAKQFTGEWFHLKTEELFCEFPEVSYGGQFMYENTYPEPHVEEVFKCEGFSTGSGNFGTGCGVPITCPTPPVLMTICEHAFSGPGGKEYEGSQLASGYNRVYGRLWETLANGFWWAAFPAEGLKGSESGIVTPPPGKVESLPRIATPVTPPAPLHVPAPARHTIIEKADRKPTKHEKEVEEETQVPAKPAPLIPPIEEGAPIPNPSNPVVPEPGHDELFTSYRAKVEAAGFTDVQERILPENAEDPEVGPSDVVASRISPSPGTAADPGTEVEVGTNPADAPPPTEGHKPVGSPTEPGINFPKFGVLCEGFPFGVPCWLAKTVEGWSAASKPPEWGINSFSVEGHTIPGHKFDLAKLEPVMEVVRPAMLVFATIGLVLLFYTFAKGGGPPSGSGGDSGAREVDIPEGGGTYWES